VNATATAASTKALPGGKPVFEKIFASVGQFLPQPHIDSHWKNTHLCPFPAQQSRRRCLWYFDCPNIGANLSNYEDQKRAQSAVLANGTECSATDTATKLHVFSATALPTGRKLAEIETNHSIGATICRYFDWATNKWSLPLQLQLPKDDRQI